MRVPLATLVWILAFTPTGMHTKSANHGPVVPSDNKLPWNWRTTLASSPNEHLPIMIEYHVDGL